MNALAQLASLEQIPEPEQMRLDFAASLNARASEVAQHALEAWDGETADDINANLERARSILHQIAQTARALGHAELGVTAQHCKTQIVAHLEGDYADLAICPGEIIWFVDTFVEACNAMADAS